MTRNRSVEHWLLYLTNQLKVFQIHSSFHAKLKNAAPKVSQPVFLWELKIYIYLNKYWLSSSPAEPTLPVCLRWEGRQGQSWDMMLWSSPCSIPHSTHPCPDQPLLLCFPLLLSPLKNRFWHLIFLWFCWGVNAPEKGLWLFFSWSY